MTGLILSLIMGYLAHRLDEPFDKHFQGVTTNYLIRYMSGGVLVTVAFLLICDIPREQKERALKSLLLSWMTVGGGVAVARLEDVFKEYVEP